MPFLAEYRIPVSYFIIEASDALLDVPSTRTDEGLTDLHALLVMGEDTTCLLIEKLLRLAGGQLHRIRMGPHGKAPWQFLESADAETHWTTGYSLGEIPLFQELSQAPVLSYGSIQKVIAFCSSALMSMFDNRFGVDTTAFCLPVRGFRLETV